MNEVVLPDISTTDSLKIYRGGDEKLNAEKVNVKKRGCRTGISQLINNIRRWIT